MDDAAGRIIVLGVGNELLRDEGVGVIAARAFGQETLPSNVDVVDGATGGLDLIFELEGFDQAIIIDAADMGLQPGTVRSFRLDEVQTALATPIASLHEISLVDALEIGKLTGPMPEVRIVGIQPREIAPGTGLSPEIGAAIPRIIQEVHSIIASLEQDSTHRSGSTKPEAPKEALPVADASKVLVVDDDPDIVESIRMVLESADYEVQEAPSAQEALEKTTDWEPDIILLDIMMPDGTEGFHFVWKLRNEYPDAVKNTPIVVLSAIHSTTNLRFYPDQSDGTYEPGEYLPVQGFIDKPAEPAALLAKIKEALEDAA